MFITASRLNAVPGIRHGYFTRKGGVSTGIFAELNCGGRGSAEPAAIVDENRRRVAETLSLPLEKLICVHQVHGPQVEIVDATWTNEQRPKADAMATKDTGLGLGVLSADCAPVLFADPAQHVIGAAHAGWKGASSGVLQATIAAMETLGAQRENIVAAVGPCIGQASYEVDPVFYARFIEMDAKNAEFFIFYGTDGKYGFDLAGYVARTLTQAGIQNVEVLGNNTYVEEEQFYSYRRSVHRSERDYGRQISVITLL